MRAWVAALLVLAAVPAPGQFLKNLVNANVQVDWTHPPALGVAVRRVALAPGASPDERELVAAIAADLARDRLEVLGPDRVAAAARDLGLDPAAPVDARTAQDLGRALGGDPAGLVLVAVRIQQLQVVQVRTPPGPGSPGGFHRARTRVVLRATIQAVDAASGRAFPVRTLATRPSRERASPMAQAPFPPDAPVRREAMARVRTRVRRLVAPWTTRHRIVFFEDQDFGLRDAFLALKAGDRQTALDRSRRALEAVRAAPSPGSRLLGRARFNLGICHFLLGDYQAALPHLQAARDSTPGSAMFRQAVEACEHAWRLRTQ